MADIAAGDVTYTVNKQRKEESGNKINSVTIAFGNSTLTYPSGGIPLTSASMGCPNNIVSAVFVGANSADGIVYKYDKVNNKIRMYRSAGFTPAGANDVPAFTGSALGSHVHDTLFIGGITATEAVAIQGGDTLGKNAATNRTIAGASSATKGGNVAVSAGTPAGTVAASNFTGTAVAAGNMIELVSATTAVVAATVYMEVIGW